MSQSIRPRGILDERASAERFRLSLLRPADDLTPFVEHHWIVRWDLRGQEPYKQETLPHPSIHLVFQRDESRVAGVMTGKFSVVLRELGAALGVKFRPGAFHPFLRRPVRALTNAESSLESVFGIGQAARRSLEHRVLASDDDASMVQVAEDFLRDQHAEADETVSLLTRLIESIVADRRITRVEDVASLAGRSPRTLQRIFSEYVGVSPKWVIRRYRLLDAAEHLANGETVDWPALALARASTRRTSAGLPGSLYSAP